MDRQQAKLGLERTVRFAYLMSWPLATSIIWCCLVPIHSARAQIVPDGTLGAESSVVTPDVEINGLPSDQIDGGATRGANLFHSFQEFNVGEGRGAYFSNPAAIENILSRVTGSNASNILGTLGVLGNANLFFINPNGIVFGPNARLDVGGSFVGSTADSLVFENGFEFSATNPEAPPLLTINIPLGLRFRESSGNLVNQSIATDNIGESVGLQVQPENTLALVGGDVAIESGGLTAPDGQIELGSVAGNNLVSLTPTDTGYALGYEGVENFQDIRLSQGAFVNTSGNGGGRIQVQGSNVTLSDESFMFANTQGSGNGRGVFLKASQLTLLGGSLITADVLGSGQGGDVTIETGQLTVRDGAFIGASTFGEGDAGNLVVNASESVELIGRSDDGSDGSGLFAVTDGSGDAGSLTIETGQLLVSDGAEVVTTTFGEGAGGNLVVNTSESVQLIGRSTDGQFPSALFADTKGAGDGDNLTIDTGQLLVSDGAEIGASTFSSGAAGNLMVKADESVQVIGTSADGQLPSGLFAVTDGSGDAGSLTIETGQLLVSDGAEVVTTTFGEGAGGNLVVKADESVQLIDGFLFAQTQGAGKAGDLRLTTGQLTVQDGAQISTTTLSKEAGWS